MMDGNRRYTNSFPARSESLPALVIWSGLDGGWFSLTRLHGIVVDHGFLSARDFVDGR